VVTRRPVVVVVVVTTTTARHTNAVSCIRNGIFGIYRVKHRMRKCV